MYASLTLLNLQHDVHGHVNGHLRVYAGAERGSYSVDYLIPFNLSVQGACDVCVRTSNVMHATSVHAMQHACTHVSPGNIIGVFADVRVELFGKLQVRGPDFFTWRNHQVI